jgi:hypothetical protein
LAHGKHRDPEQLPKPRANRFSESSWGKIGALAAVVAIPIAVIGVFIAGVTYWFPRSAAPTINSAVPSSRGGPANSASSTEEQAPAPFPSCSAASATDDEATIAFSPKVPTLVRFTSPKQGAPRIDIPSNVCVQGTVEKLPAGHALWILSKPRDSNDPKTFFFVVGGNAVQEGNGAWSTQAYSVGNETDKGKGFDFYAVDAGDDTCEKLLKVAAQSKENGVLVRRVRFDVQNICTILEPAAGVTFKN